MQKTCIRKLLYAMKICAAQGLIAMLICGVSIAHDNYGQVLERPVTVSMSAVEFAEALKQVEHAAQIKFFYSMDQIQNEPVVTIHLIDQPLRKVLDDLLSPRRFDYKVNEKDASISIKKRKEKQSYTEPSGKPTFATITGVVTEAGSGQPMAGVNVIVKGTTTGTTTDADGRFTIEASANDVLVFSFIGYKTTEETVGNRTELSISISEDLQSLQEVVVNAGYWDVKDKERTGNIGRVTASDISKQPVSNPLAALQGRVPGLEIIQQTGVPGGNFQIRIRGTNSIANGNDPLFIIDGVPFISSTMAFNETSLDILFNGTSPLNGLNPTDIESIEVLKDADATAIYGSRGANGVILITTKKGKAGTPKIDVNFYTGVGKVASRLDLLSSQQYVEMRKEAIRNGGGTPNPSNAPDLISWDTTRYTDWQRELLGGTATTTDAQFSVSGGDQLNQFTAGMGYHQESSVFPGNNADKRISVLMNINNSSANERFKSSVSLKYSVNNTSLIKTDLTSVALRLSPIAPPLYNAEGEINWQAGEWDQYSPNPLSYLNAGYEAKTKNLLLNGVISYILYKHLVIKANVGYSDVAMNAITTIPLSSLPPSYAAYFQNRTAFTTSSMNNWTVEPQLNWKPQFRTSRFDILIGTTFLSQLQEGIAQVGQGYSDESLMKNLAAASTITAGSNYYSQYRYHAVFARLNYSLHDRYILNITGRRDGSSRFGPGNQFANFGAIGLAWIFSEEEFLKSSNGLSFGKLRGSYGYTGNDQLNNYEYLDTYTSSGSYAGVAGLRPVRLANPNFAWETNKKFEIGLEFGLLKNRVDCSISYFKNESSNQLVGVPLPPTTGFPTVQGNFPARVQNVGLELIMTTKNVVHQHLTWTTSVNLYIPRNIVKDFPNLESSPSYSNTIVIGEPLSILKLYNYTGIDPTTGYYQYEDINSDGVINDADRTAIRYVGQYFSAGLTNHFHFKNFQLDIHMQYVNQNKQNYFNEFLVAPGQGYVNQPSWVMNRTHDGNNPTDVQRFSTDDASYIAYSRVRSSTKALSDASFLRVKNIALSYALPAGVKTKLGLTGGNLFIQAQNLLTITSYQGLDPETSNSSLPPLRIVSLGTHLTF